MAKQEKKDVKSVETANGVTTTTYEDGSQKVEHAGGVISAETISGGVSFTRTKK